MLEILPCRFRGEVGARGAGVGVEPVGHFGLVFGGGVFVTKYVGYLAFFAVVRAWDGSWVGLWGATRDAERVPKKVCACQRRCWGSERGVLLVVWGC